jgi:PHP-associated
MTPRAVGALMFVAALVAGSVMQAAVPDVAVTGRQRGGFTVVAADFHVHSFPGDGVLPVWDVAREARRFRLDVIALTNHNQMHSWELWLRVPHVQGTAIVIPGDEVTSGHYHMVAVGLSYPIDWDQPAAAAARAVQAQGGVAIAAHPIGRFSDGIDAEALRALDGIEAAHPVMELSANDARDLQQAFARAVSIHPAIAAIGSSDFHFFAPIGLCRTFVFATAPTEDAVLDAIRHGRTVACDARGQLHGSSALAAIVQDDCRAAAAAPAVSAHPRIEHAATALAWIGLVLILVNDERRTTNGE